MIRLALVAGLLLATLPVLAGPSVTAEVERVVDGDTFRLTGRIVRIWGIDAPELEQDCLGADGQSYSCGRMARLLLEVIVKGKPITCWEVDTDRFGQMLARCEADEIDIGHEMVLVGLALDDTHYSKGRYLPEEYDAQQARRGLWAGSFQKPWDWRRNRPQDAP